MRKIFLEKLPLIQQGTNKGKIDWIKSINEQINFIYDDIKGSFTITDYMSGKYPVLKIIYNNKNYNITTSDILRNRLGRITGKRTKDFKIPIGETFVDDKRDFVILDRELRQSIYYKNTKLKYYNCFCMKCKCENWVEESDILNGYVCNVCTNKTIIKGINDIATTNPELIKYFVNINDAYTHSYSSNKKVLCKCPNCGYEKEMKINDLFRKGFSCPRCSDSISYPEKFMFNFLQQLKENNQIKDFITQYSKANDKWCNNYRYDFYFEKNKQKCIIETHGGQHYRNAGFGISLEEQQENDKIKKELAINNEIKPQNYIIIDCRYSEPKYIKQNIINSRLGKIFDLSNINWTIIYENSEKSLAKEICNYWYIHNNINNENLSVKDLKIVFRINNCAIREYLKRGTKYGWCNYVPKINQFK